MKRQWRKHSAEFKARVAFEAIQGLKTQTEIAKEFEIHPIMMGKWKNELFEGDFSKKDAIFVKDKQVLQQKIDQLTMEVEWDTNLSVGRQCELLHIHRSQVNYQLKREIMTRIKG